MIKIIFSVSTLMCFIVLSLSFVYRNIYMAVVGFILCMILRKYSSLIPIPQKFKVIKMRINKYKNNIRPK